MEREIAQQDFLRDDGGQGLVEYALLLGLVAVALIIGLAFVRGQLGNVLQEIAVQLGAIFDHHDN